ncbi:MAG: hemerythrin domain-containing protein [Nitrospirales bacterium]
MASQSQTGVSSMVIDMLKKDHQKVKALFAEFENAKDSRIKQRIVETALMELDVHAKLEEGLVYPAIRPEIDDEDLMDEALEEHHVVHVLIAELKKMKPSDDRFDAKFTVLAENVKHHIKEEESEMFPKAEECDIDWETLEQQVMKRKEKLMAQTAGPSKNGNAKTSKKNSTGRKQR